MIYLDYSATTPVDPRVLEVFVETSKNFYANPNSIHDFGVLAKNKIDKTSSKIAKLFDTDCHEVIYTSGATEANNLAIKGVAYRYQSVGKHLITTAFEHSSVSTCFSYLQKNGFDVDIVETDKDGLVDLEMLKNMIRPDTILVSIGYVNSETGIKQEISKIAKLLKQYTHVVFHTDMTQAVGKTNISLENVDLASLSGHKIYGIKGIGALLKKNTVFLSPLIHGGKSTTPLRGGTPSTALIVSFGKALEFVFSEMDVRIVKVKEIHEHFLKRLKEIPDFMLNSNSYSINHIVNFSTMGVEAVVMQRALSKKGIYLSTQTACSSDKAYSEFIKRLTNDELRAKTSLRVSLSHLTTTAEIDTFIQALKEEVRS